LLNEGIISGPFEYMWEWNCPWASLHYLANQLIERRLVNVKQQYKNITQYIDYTSTRNLAKQYNEIVNTDDPEETRPYQNENTLIDRALSRLVLERDNQLKAEM
jgi:hypothetical protein